MPNLFLCHPACSTCKKARAWLAANRIPFVEQDIRTPNPTAAQLRDWSARSDLPPRRFFNTSGLQYRSLGLSEKLDGMTPDEMLALLATDGMLVKRPILVTESGTVLVGFREPEWERALAGTGAPG